MRKKFSVVLGLLLIAALFISACSGSAPETQQQAPAEQAKEEAAPAEQPKEEAAPAEQAKEEAPAQAGAELSGELTMWVMPNGADPQAAIDAEIAAFNELYPNVSVSAEIVGWGDAYGRIQTAVQGGEGPCITQLGTTWVPTFGTMGGLHVFTDAELNELGGPAQFVQASWDTAAVEGSVVSIPWFADVRAIAYRADIFEQVGIDPNEAFKDIDSFIAALEKIKEANLTDESGLPIAPFHHPGRNDWNVWQNAAMWIWAYGGDLLSADGTAAAFNSPEAVQGVTTYYGLYGRGLTPEDTLELNSAQADSRFGEGTSASYITGPWIISNARDLENSGWTEVAAKNLAFAPFPKGPGGQYTFVGGSNLGILESCANKDAALAFVKYLLSKESQIRYANAIGMLPTTKEAQNDPVFTEDPLFSVFIESAQYGKTALNIPAWGQVENNLQSALQALFEDVAELGIGNPIDQDTVQQRLDEAAETINSLLKQSS